MPHARRWISALLLASATLIGQLASSQPVAAANQPIRPPIVCPDRLDDLMPLLLRDLPSYANRINQQAYQLDRDANTPGYVVLASQPDYAPLTLAAGEKLPAAESDTPQVFFTTLERQYVDGQLIRLQHYHWLFITPTETRGWRLVLLYSAIGTYPSQPPSAEPPSELPSELPTNQGLSTLQPSVPFSTLDQPSQFTPPPSPLLLHPSSLLPPLTSPPEDTSQGVIAQAIRQWLRDCEAGSVVGEG